MFLYLNDLHIQVLHNKHATQGRRRINGRINRATSTNAQINNFTEHQI